MKLRFSLILVVAATSLVLACGDDDGGGGNPDAMAGVPDADPNAPDAAPPVAVSGQMRGDMNAPIVGALVEVLNASPANSTTTDASGNWTLMISPGTVLLKATVTGSWGSLNQVVVPAGGLTNYDRLSPVSDADVNSVAMDLDRTILDTNGIVGVDFDGTIIGGETATISAASDPAFTFNANGDPVESATLLGAGQEGSLIFSNVPVGTATVTIGSGGSTCTLETVGALPVQAKVITDFTATCI